MSLILLKNERITLRIVSWVCLVRFFGRIQDFIICFRDLLTFKLILKKIFLNKNRRLRKNYARVLKSTLHQKFENSSFFKILIWLATYHFFFHFFLNQFIHSGLQVTEKIFAKCGKPRTVSKRDTYSSGLTGNGNSNSDIETEINSNYQDQIPEEAKTSALISSSSTDQVCMCRSLYTKSVIIYKVLIYNGQLFSVCIYNDWKSSLFRKSWLAII